MPKLSRDRVPAYSRHRASGQAVVTLSGRDIYLGKYNSAASREAYNRLIAEWLANGRALPAQDDITVLEVLARFIDHAERYYRKPDGTPTSELANFRDAMRPLKRLYGRTPAGEFGPLKLKALREEMVKLDWCRNTINRHTSRIRSIFKWAAECELIPPSIHHGLAAVAGLKAGRSDARESEPVKPVPDAFVDAVHPFVGRQVWAMIELQRLTGMRPGEVTAMRGCDLDTSGKLWTYRPAQHKTQHHGHERIVYLGPRARKIVQPFLKPDLAAFLFSPADAERERRDKLYANRSTPLSCGNVPGSNVKRKPKKAPGQRYAVESYCRAIHMATDRADAWAKGGKIVAEDVRVVPRWHPHQLRHSAATNLRKEYGLEAAQVILGQKTLTVTQVYAEKNVALAEKIVAEVG